MRKTISTCAAVLVLGLTACGDDDTKTTSDSTKPKGAEQETSTTAAAPKIDPGDGGNYKPDIDPSRFVEGIDNPYLPFKAGARWVYEETSEGETERIEVVVTDEQKTVMGIEAVVVRDTVTVDGVLFEDTRDWFAQDVDGNVWYLGEVTEEHDDGEVSTEGSWEAGVDGALPGIVMFAKPEVGKSYRQEFYKGEAEDLAKIVRDDESVDVPAGSYTDVFVIEEWNPFEPETLEEKSFAPGVGLVLEEKTAGGEGRVELIEFTPGS